VSVTVVGVESLGEVDLGAMSLADQAYLIIQDKLIMLDIRPNEAIVESELAAGLGLGRTPVREALKRLEADRLVISFPRRGTFATGVDVADLRHISQIRVNLEPVAARTASSNPVTWASAMAAAASPSPPAIVRSNSVCSPTWRATIGSRSRNRQKMRVARLSYWISTSSRCGLPVAR